MPGSNAVLHEGFFVVTVFLRIRPELLWRFQVPKRNSQSFDKLWILVYHQIAHLPAAVK